MCPSTARSSRIVARASNPWPKPGAAEIERIGLVHAAWTSHVVETLADDEQAHCRRSPGSMRPARRSGSSRPCCASGRKVSDGFPWLTSGIRIRDWGFEGFCRSSGVGILHLRNDASAFSESRLPIPNPGPITHSASPPRAARARRAGPARARPAGRAPTGRGNRSARSTRAAAATGSSASSTG